MIKSNIPLSVKQMQSMYEKGTLNLDFAIQRGEQWDIQKKSLLIHSILQNYFVPPIFAYKEMVEDDEGNKLTVYNLIDGKQRSLALLSYCKGLYPLSEDIPTIITEEGEIEIAGKSFEELSHDFQEELLRFKLVLYSYEDCDIKVIEQCFFRLNNGESLSKVQVSRARLGVSISTFLAEMLKKPFFPELCVFTKLQQKKEEYLNVLLQSMMLLDEQLTTFSDKDIMKYAESLEREYPQEKRDYLNHLLDYLHDSILDKNKFMKKINIPIIMKVGSIAIDRNISSDNFFDWFTDFLEDNEILNEYKQFCGSGSTKQSSVQGRLDVMLTHFNNYFKNLESKEEVKEEIATTENVTE